MVAKKKKSRIPEEDAAKRALFERIYLLFKNKTNDGINLKKVFSLIKSSGIRTTDQRLHGVFQKLHEARKKAKKLEDDGEAVLDKETFFQAISCNLDLFLRIVKSDLVVPEMKKFRSRMHEMYRRMQRNKAGQNADYIPQLARVPSNYLGLSICTVDGQRISIGETNIPFCLQQTSKALNYVIAVSDFGAEYVHRYIGQEPSGRSFNELTLDSNSKPHNPMINSGAIICCSLLKPRLARSDRFDEVITLYKRMSGDEFVGFSNATYLSERDMADRDYALAHFMKEHNCFPETANLEATLQFYFQLSSVEVTTDSAAVIAATLANGGVCPINEDPVVKPEAVRNCLSLMYSCGMSDYSGQFAFKVGLPAKSGLSGAVLLVVPNVMGVCIWSPRLDVQGNSVRGVQFCEELVAQCNFHNYDNLKHSTRKWDPRRRELDVRSNKIVPLLLAASHGDLSAIKRFHFQGINPDGSDYDMRTALHLAAAEGHSDVVLYLLYQCRSTHDLQDRWGFTPLDDAKRFNRFECVRIIEEYEACLDSQEIPSYEEVMAANSQPAADDASSIMDETMSQVSMMDDQGSSSSGIQTIEDGTLLLQKLKKLTVSV